MANWDYLYIHICILITLNFLLKTVFFYEKYAVSTETRITQIENNVFLIENQVLIGFVKNNSGQINYLSDFVQL